MVNVGFGASTYSSYTTDSSYTLIATNVSVPARRTAYNGKGPQLITDVGLFAAGYSGTITFKIYADGKKTGSISRAADSTPTTTGYQALTSPLYIADGTTVTFGVSGPSGGVRFYRSGSGSTTATGNGSYTWAGTMRGTYKYDESPTAPQNLTATPSPTTSGVINLAWSAPSDNGGSSITGYEVYVSTGGTYSHFGLVPSTTYTYAASGLSAGTSYSFQVRALNAVTEAAGTTSVSSNTATASAPSIIPVSNVPTAPTSLTASTSTTTLGAVNLSWAAPTSNGGSSITNYLIYVDGIYYGALGSANLASTPDYVVTGLPELGTRSFTVTAVNINGEGPQATSVSQAASGLPTKPLNLSATADTLVSNKINLTWDAPSQAGGGITGYLIYNASTNALIVDRDVATYPDRAYSITTGLTTGTEYSYYVKAYNAIGIAQAPDAYSPASDSASAVAITVTGAPSVVSSEAVPSRLIVSWAPTPSASSYVVTNTNTGAAKTVSAYVTSYAWDGLDLDTEYGFTKKPNNGATSDVGYGTTGIEAAQSVSGTKTVTNITNTELSTTSAIITSVPTPSSFTYSKSPISDVVDTQILTVANATATNKLNKALTDADGVVQKPISATGTFDTFSYVNAGVPDVDSTNVSGGVTLLNRTNAELNSSGVTVTGYDAGAKTFTYAKSTDSAIIAASISNRSSGGTVTNLSQTTFNVTNEPITAVTEYTVSYAKTAADQATSAASGSVVNNTNKDVFNAGVGSSAVVTAPDYKTVTYALVPATKVSISTTARSGYTVTVTTATPHAFKQGDTVYIAGSTNGSGVFNGTWPILGVADDTHFTFTHGSTGVIASTSDTAATADINVSEKTVANPTDSVTRLSSNSNTNLDIIYRSGWIG